MSKRVSPARLQPRLALLGLCATVALLVACGGDSPVAQRTTPPGSTPWSQGVTPLATRYVPGTVALFDVRNETAKSIDIGTAILRAEWIDDGDTILALDGYSGKFVAMKLDGTVVREIANMRATTGYEPMPLIWPVAVHDGHSVAISDWESESLSLFDIDDGSTVVLQENARAGGTFSPDGKWLAGYVTPLGDDGTFDVAHARGGIFLRDGDCDSERSFVCLKWELPKSADGPQLQFSGKQVWSPDGKHLLMERRKTCPHSDPRTAGSEPCSPRPTSFEVYAWPSGKLVLTIPVGQVGDARWVGAKQLHVRGADDPAFPARPGFLVDMDGNRSAAPELLVRCCRSFSPDGRCGITSLIPGEDCSLVEITSGRTVATVPKGPGDTNDTGICEIVSWTQDGSRAIATGVNLADIVPTPAPGG